MGEHSVCVGARKKAVGGLSQSSNSMLLRGDMLCVIQRERKGEKKKRGEAECQFTFHSSYYSSVTQASAQACLSRGIHTVLTTYSERPHYRGFIKHECQCLRATQIILYPSGRIDVGSVDSGGAPAQ